MKTLMLVYGFMGGYAWAQENWKGVAACAVAALATEVVAGVQIERKEEE